MTTLCPSTCRRGAFTLLEVLVACGILVVALSSIAAILPAAASRLAEATATDRAAAMTSIAFSELSSRGLADRAMFPNAASPAAIVLGEGLSATVLTTVTNSGYAGLRVFSGVLTASGTAATTGTGTLSRGGVAILTQPNWPTFNIAVDSSRGFAIEDDVRYVSGTAGPMPMNQFFTGTSGSTHFRQFASGVCWGAVLSPEPWGTTAGAASAIRASIAVFRKPPIAVAMSLRQQVPGLFVTGTWPAAIQRTRLRPCSAVLALPDPTLALADQFPPQWFRIRSSWVSGTDSRTTLDAMTSGSAVASVIFDRTLPTSMLSSGSLTILTFDSLLSTDQRILPIR